MEGIEFCGRCNSKHIAIVEENMKLKVSSGKGASRKAADCGKHIFENHFGRSLIQTFVITVCSL